MKKTNKKGFTLIELLAVIVILALLVAVAIPAVTKYLNTSRINVFADNAAAAVSAVRNKVIIDGNISSDGKYYIGYDNAINNVNDILEKKLKNRPYNKQYNGYVEVKEEKGEYRYYIYLTDTTHCLGTNNGSKVSTLAEGEIDAGNVKPGDCKAIELPDAATKTTTK